MKTALFFAVALTLIACQKNADFSKPDNTPYAAALHTFAPNTHHDAPGNGEHGGTLSSTYCIEFSSSHWLVGQGEFKPLKEVASSLTSRIIRTPVASETGLITIRASGDGMSEKYGRSRSEMYLEYNTRLNRLTGKIVTQFFNGEVLEQAIESQPLVINDRTSMILRAEVRVGSFFDGSEDLAIVKGEIVIALPKRPEGWLETNVYSTVLVCTSVTQ